MKIVNVGMAEIKTTNSSDEVLTAPGLGSCIGLLFYDEASKWGIMAHIVLPDSLTLSEKSVRTVGKCADTAVPEMINIITRKGLKPKSMKIYMAGGAQMFSFGSNKNILNVGQRNVIATKAALMKQGLSPIATDTGGNKGRTLRLDAINGIVYMKKLGEEEIILGGKYAKSINS